MPSFHAFDFIYDDVPSQRFDLKIINFEDGGLFQGVGSSNVEIYTQRVLRKAKPYYLGRSQQPVLEFPLTFGTDSEISALDRDLISRWLFGRDGYKKLYILQDDLNGAYFNCFLTNPTPLYIGNMNFAFQCNVVCDSPFAYSFLNITSGSYTGTTSATIEIYNNSSEEEYLYPEISFKLNTLGSSFSLTNTTDSNRVFGFGLSSGSPLIPSEEIYVNNDLQIITSSTGLRRVSHFNKNWLRLLPKLNTLTLSASLSWLTIYYRNKIKIGG